MSADRDLSPESRAVHAGSDQYEYGPVVPPIYQTSTFAFESADHGAALFAGKGRGYIYTRMGNPTIEALENCVAELEGGFKGLACASGMAAIHTTLATLLEAGDHVVCSEAVYGPTCTLVESEFPRLGVESDVVDTSDLGAVERAMRPNTKVVFVETPGNPTLVISDIEAVAEIAHDHGALLVVDNTFMSPILQQPFKWGADMVVHSLTKFLNGHADVVGGMIIARNESQYTMLRAKLNLLGGVLPPLEAFLVHRGIRTLALRMERHSENAQKVAEFLEAHELVDWVAYPGLESHPQHAIAKKQMSRPGGMISFGLKGGLDAGKALINAVRLCSLAVSLGGVETLIQHPASMTHASMGPEARKRARITDGLVRISVGIENVDDLIADLEQALTAAGAHTGAAPGRRPSDSGDEPASSLRESADHSSRAGV